MNSFSRIPAIGLRLVGIFVGVMVLTSSVPAQGGSGAGSTNRSSGNASHTVRGKIYLPSGSLPEQRIRVVLELNTGGIAGETFSDSVGNFEFRSITSNSYRVVIPSDGRVYETTQEPVDVYGNFSRTFTVQIYLRDKDPEIVAKPKGMMVSAAEFSQNVPKDAIKLYEKGEKKSREGKPEEAIPLFLDSLKVFPDYLLALSKLGEQYVITQKLPEARAAFEKALAVNSKYPLAHINLGMLLCQLKRYPEAIEHLETANKQDESYPMAHLYLGLALMEKQPADYDQAERELLKARALGGQKMAYVRKHLFNLNYRRQALDKAAQSLEEYLKEAPDAPDAASVRDMLVKVKKMIARKSGQAEQSQKP